VPRGPKGEKRPPDVIGAAIMIGKIATVKPTKFQTEALPSFVGPRL